MSFRLLGRFTLLACVVVLGSCSGPDSKKSAGSKSATDGGSDTGTESEVKLSESNAKGKKRIEEIGGTVKLAEGEITQVLFDDCSNVGEADVELIGGLSKFQKLQFENYRTLNDETVAKLAKLQNLTSLSITNTVITDATVDFIVSTFPKLTELDLSSNTNMTPGALDKIAKLAGLKTLVLVQNRFNEISTLSLEDLKQLKVLDLRGNMEAGNLSMEVVAGLPELTAFKHRSNIVSDDGMEKFATASKLESLLIQDFLITGQSGQHLAKLTKLKQLEIFRCQAFDSQGVLALKGMGFERLTLRGLPAVDDSAMEVLKDLPKLKKLFLHELDSVSDNGLKNLASLQSLELLDVWSVSQLTDATLDVIAKLPNLRELSLRTTGVTDAAVEKILAMPKLQVLTMKENGSVSEAALKKLESKKWTKLDIGKK
jgi:Leucine-rich repeat (LRR) protein